MSFGPYTNAHKYAPGLGGKIDGQIQKILNGWRKAGIGVVRERKRK